jgi:hypothetical protein
MRTRSEVENDAFWWLRASLGIEKMGCGEGCVGVASYWTLTLLGWPRKGSCFEPLFMHKSGIDLEWPVIRIHEIPLLDVFYHGKPGQPS